MTRPDREYLSRAVRTAAREAIWYALCRHEQGPKRNILLFATRRGGSTWAMELIAANAGVRPLNQPLEVLSRNITMAQMLDIPRFHDGQITSLTEREARLLDGYVDGLLSGRIIVNGPTKFWSDEFVRRSDRVVLKITDAKPVIEHFADAFDVEVVYLTRHPVPQSMSCIRNGWTLTVDAHLSDGRFVESHLSAAAEARAHDVMRSGTDLEKFVLNWSLENVAPMRALPGRPEWVHVRYEDCVVQPDVVIANMSDRLGLDDHEAMRSTVDRPSGSSRRSTAETRSAITGGDAAARVDAWRNEISADDVSRLDDLLTVMGIDLNRL